MENHESIPNISVVWRGKKFSIEMSSDATLKELGLKLQKLTDVRADTMRLIVPKYSNKTSKLLSPFSNDQAFLSLEETSVTKVKSIRMMGVPETEVDEILQSAKADLRIAGFEEEEKRLRQRMSDRPQASLKLPQGPYIFCDFRTLEIPGIELNPPASEALKRMHMLAADPGIVAIMNKHRWRIGIMTEMAPIGYVGVSPKCILGFNKNHGEEISMRLRTDDLKGFRKYESIKKTLLHELAHMVYSEHDANFYALDKQLNQEAASLDWTRSRSQTLNGVRNLEHYEEDLFNGDSGNSTWKLGGNTLDQLASARASSVAAAYRRLANASMNSLGGSVVNEEPDPDDSGFNTLEQTASMELIEKENLDICNPNKAERKPAYEPDPDDHSGNLNKLEPDPDDHSVDQDMLEPDPDDHSGDQDMLEPDPDDNSGDQVKLEPDTDDHSGDQDKLEPDPDDHSGDQDKLEPDPDDHSGNQISIEPDPDDSHGGESLESSFHPEFTRSRIILGQNSMDSWSMQLLPPSETGRKLGIIKLDAEPDPDEVLEVEIVDSEIQTRKNVEEPDPDDSLVNGVLQAEPDPDDNLVHQLGMSGTRTHEPDPDDQELQRIQDPVTVVCSRLQKAIEMLQVGLKPAEATAAVQTLFKIIRNVIEHPDEMKYRRLRKANPVIKRNVASYQAAMEILSLIGFNEDVLLDEIGKAETYLVLKRNDPGLLWLAKSSLETCIA